ncbi:hypothetical protein [Hymenobacter sp. 5414T-23]|uniref:hypothetical protein n=1 Tax=Hymenobacter sp. 5414T-23 TaxID=2932252 RepID=UPI001FD503DE|nr:hypothetical protein [Hymenobacter sp. 5414T-23]UOQ81619.1 hypothetical protein MUN83_02130 [Hymenobacter sp. 5414T-23]
MPRYIVAYPTTWSTAGRARLRAAMLLLALSAGLSSVHAQTDSLRAITKRVTAYNQQALQEKLYLHLDRPLYISGEIIWFKVNATDDVAHRPLALSQVAYVEVLDKEQRPVLQTKVALQQAKGHGSLALPASLASGNYTVRAYTNWMKNFSPDCFFHANISIVNTRTTLGLKVTKDTTSYTAQFFPEGGTLVKGVTSKVGFKIVDKTGKGIAATGTLLDQRGATVATFSTLKYGLGSFVLTPQATGAVYTAVLTLPNKQAFTRKLPVVAAQGVVLRVEEASPTQLRIGIESTVPGQAAEELLLLGHSRQQVAVSALTRLQAGKATVLVDRKTLPEGVTHFTVFNQEKKPLCERLFFTRPTHQLAITGRTAQQAYGTREKVNLQIATASAQAQPLPANMSLAVFRLDSLPSSALPNIHSYLWLTSDLKGNIENPDYYVSTPGPEAEQASDNLMLTHGWSRFRWADVLAGPSKPFQYLSELQGLTIPARVTTGGGKPAPGVIVYMATPSPKVNLFNSLSNSDGLVLFEASGLYSANDLILQTNTQKDSTYQIELLNPFSQQYSKSLPLPFTFSERNQQDILSRSLEMQTQNAYFSKQQAIFKLPVSDSAAFYGKPDEQYLLDEFTRFKVLEEVMREYVPGVQVRLRKDGFHFLVMDHVNNAIFPENPLVLLDGVPVFDINKIMAMDPLKIKKLDVMTSAYFQGPRATMVL